MSVSGTPVTTYDDGFPKAHPSLPPSTRRSGRSVVHRRTLVALTDDHGRPQARVAEEGWGPAISSGRAREPRHSSRRSDREPRGEGGRGGWGLGKPVVVRRARRTGTRQAGGGPDSPIGFPKAPPPPPPPGVSGLFPQLYRGPARTQKKPGTRFSPL